MQGRPHRSLQWTKRDPGLVVARKDARQTWTRGRILARVGGGKGGGGARLKFPSSAPPPQCQRPRSGQWPGAMSLRSKQPVYASVEAQRGAQGEAGPDLSPLPNFP